MVGAVGDRRVLTPNFDALAARGTAFVNARCQNGNHGAVCIPSRAALHTGREVCEVPMDCGNYPTIGSTLRAAGYVTHGIGKWHNERASYQRSFGSGSAIFFDGMHEHIGTPLHDYDPAGIYVSPKPSRKFSSVAFADAAIEFLERHDPARPFFLFIGWTSPHDPRTPPPEFASLYDAGNLELPPNFLPQHPFDNGELWIRDEMLAPHPRTPEAVRQHMADYFAMVSEMDAQFGRVMAALERLGIGRDTLVVHTADHGLAVGQHGLMGKQNLYEHSVRVPLLMAGPGIPINRREDSLVYGFDTAPACLEWAGVPEPGTMTARSLLSRFTGAEPARDHVVAAYKNLQKSVTVNGRKLIRYSVNGRSHDQLFDLTADPWETENLATELPDLVSEMEALLTK